MIINHIILRAKTNKRVSINDAITWRAIFEIAKKKNIPKVDAYQSEHFESTIPTRHSI